jgi:hypothetical protein
MIKVENGTMYLETGLGQTFKPRYKPARVTSVAVRWDLEVPFRKYFGAFRQELSKAIELLVTAEPDKKAIDQMLRAKNREIELKQIHNRLLKRKSPKVKESDAVGVTVTIGFWKADYTDMWGIDVKEQG